MARRLGRPNCFFDFSLFVLFFVFFVFFFFFFFSSIRSHEKPFKTSRVMLRAAISVRIESSLARSSGRLARLFGSPTPPSSVRSKFACPNREKSRTSGQATRTRFRAGREHKQWLNPRLALGPVQESVQVSFHHCSRPSSHWHLSSARFFAPPPPLVVESASSSIVSSIVPPLSKCTQTHRETQRKNEHAFSDPEKAKTRAAKQRRR